MKLCAVDCCEESVTRKDHTLCYAHWVAQRDGDLSDCRTCGRLKEGQKPLCHSCFQKKSSVKQAPEKTRSTPREAGQGAREIAAQMVRKSPVKSFLNKFFDFANTSERAWRVGADSEESTGLKLRELGTAWAVRHDITLDSSGANADHVVVGPAGAFVIDTKFRSGEVVTARDGIRVDGRRTKMAEGVQDQARVIYGRLKDVVGAQLRWVQPVLAFDNAVGGRRDPDGVHVVCVEYLVDYFTDLPRELDSREVKRIGAALLDDRTWAL